MTPSEKMRLVWIPLAAALLAVLVFFNSLANEFVWDDNELIVDNPAIHSFCSVPQFFSSHFWSQSSQPSARGYFRPLILLSYVIDYSLWGPNPFGFHLANVLWHALASALVCMLVMRLTPSAVAALVAGALFAVHPVHVESVTFVSGRTDVIATVFVLIAACLFLDIRNGRPMTYRLLLSLLFFGFAVLAKEVAVVLPALLLVGEATIPSSGSRRVRIPVHAIFWLLLALYLVARFALMRIAPELQGRLGAKELLLTMPVVALDYACLLLVPIRLCADYAVNVRHSLTPASITSVIFLALACGAVGFLIARKRTSGFFGAWIVLGLLPVLQIIPISVLKAERFLYLPSVGFCALVGWLTASIYDGTDKRRKRLIAAALVLVVLGLSLRTSVRNTAWRDEFTLYKITASCAPDNFRVQYNLGNAYYRGGDIKRALHHTEIAFRLRPDFPRVNYNLGVIYAAMGRLREAETMYRRAMEFDPAYAQPHNNLAAILYAEGRTEEARIEWSIALSLDPSLEQAIEGLRLLEQRTER